MRKVILSVIALLWCSYVMAQPKQGVPGGTYRWLGAIGGDSGFVTRPITSLPTPRDTGQIVALKNATLWMWQPVVGWQQIGVAGNNNYPQSFTYNSATGVLTLTRNGLSPITVNVYADTLGNVSSKNYLQGQLQNVTTGFQAYINMKLDTVYFRNDSLFGKKQGLTTLQGKIPLGSGLPSKVGGEGKYVRVVGGNYVLDTVVGGSGAGTTYTASNGLTKSGNDFQLGGVQTSNTVIDGNGHDFKQTTTGETDLGGGFYSTLNSDTTGGTTDIQGYFTRIITGKDGNKGAASILSPVLNASYVTGTLGIVKAGSTTTLNSESFFVTNALKPSSTPTDSALTRIPLTGQLFNSKIAIAASAVTSGTFPAARFAGTTTDGYVLTLASGIPTWSAASGGGGTITLTGDVTGSGTSSIPTTLANTAVTSGSYTNANITVDSKGRLTAASNGSSGGTAVTNTYVAVGTGSSVTGYAGLAYTMPSGGSILKAMSSGTSAGAELWVVNNAGNDGRLFKLATGYGGYKTLAANDLGFYTASGNITIFNDNTSGNVTLTAGSASTAQLTVTPSGYVYIRAPIVQVSPNGTCWSITVDNSGNRVATSITCP